MRLRKLIDLSKEQLEIVNNWNDNILLTAIPGSGKTRTIVQKIIEQIRLNKTNKYIVAITYTNRAAEEMLERIFKEIEPTEQVFIGTIHSFCYEFIFKRNYDKIPFYKKGYKLISPEEEKRLVKNVANNYKLTSEEEKKIRFNYIKTTINRDGYYCEKSDNLIKILDDFYKTLRENSLINFDYLLYLSYKLLCDYKYIANNLKSAIESFYIDEYQDTNQLQYEILSEIYKANNKKQQLVLVGDTNQAIYTSLGSVIKNISQLQFQFKTTFIHKQLTGCYRSCQSIIDFYKKFAVNDVDMNSKISRPCSNSIECSYVDENTMYTRVIEIIHDLLKQGIKENEICIMAPTWYLLLPLSNKLKEMMPNIKFDAPEISPIKRNDDLPLYKLSKLICMKINHKNINYKRMLVIDFRKKFEECYSIKLEFNIDEFLTIIERRRKKLIYDSGLKYLEEEMRFFINNYFMLNSDNINNDITLFIDEVNNRISDEKFKLKDTPDTFISMFSRKDGIVISTCHGVKGEEYDTVICLYVNEGKIPYFSYSDNREIAKRLLFVMFSRAKRAIYIFPIKGEKYKEPTKEITPFINE